ncbi:acyl-CoA carboxylase subunit beta [Pseudobutyrivibrio xylanivorans]|uniref:Acyl-CoA carboxylase subunit beta n=1 Tax=Pseudobutyrivibrio xylanivorans TaxID=185007 RepID=A0A5P6VW03_PSEXY|nr:acyl-CoA carboxylase subunit beta [Pseudobutyrivibrio xylanivorans]QFJ56094.1 acyl-CoA carboxylase subunit beta [Pseudobutyrivibrio xylanivorans]
MSKEQWNPKYIEDLKQRRAKAKAGGGEKRVEAQHAKGKLTVWERISYLFDEGSFQEVGSLVESRFTDMGMDKKKLPGDGVVTGFGTINGVPVYVAAEDFTVMGGTYGEYHSRKIVRIMDMAFQSKAPFITINDSGGARMEEGISGLDGYGDMFLRHTRASGKIPQIAVIMGPCAGGACYGPALCDYVFMVEKTSQMFLTGPVVVKTVLGENISTEELGGATSHSSMSGVAHFKYPSEYECLDGVKKLLSYLPKNYREKPVRIIGKARDHSEELQEIVTDNQKRAYDIHKVIDTFVDEGSFFEVHEDFGKSIVVGYCRIDSEVVGIVASNPMFLGGALDIDSSEKAARFVRCCDCYGIPLLTLIDVPGFMPGSKMEHGGIIRRGAKLLYAYCEASVPKVSLILRKAYGGSYIAMNSKGMGADIVYAWPIAQIAVMGAEGAVGIMYKHELENAANPEQVRQEKIQEYNDKFMSPYIAAKLGIIDEVISPEETRRKIRTAFESLSSKERSEIAFSHGNIPL